MKKIFLLSIFLSIAQLTIGQESDAGGKRETIKDRILEARSILQNDSGSLWGVPIWNDSLIVIDFDGTIYSLVELPGSRTDDSILFYKEMEPNSLSFVNTTRRYEGGEYATVLINYLEDKSATIIHELFHLLQYKYRSFKGDPIDYLDQTEARILLRLEYQSLRNALNAINEGKTTADVQTFLKDAVTFRKERQRQYADWLIEELEIETLEGLANYTGFVLSGYENKYEQALTEIDKREAAETYTRPFPYATGVAYGLVFDHLGVHWRDGLEKIYNFADIYEKEVLKSELRPTEALLDAAKSRSNYDDIYSQEVLREEKQNRLIAYYTGLLVERHTLKVAISDMDNYECSFNMNGTLMLDGHGIVYSNITGHDRSAGNNFGNFSTVAGMDELGRAGILSYEDNGTYYFVFPAPTDASGSKITGEFYEIELNPGWTVLKHDDGNMEIVK